MQTHFVIFLCGFISGFALLISGNTLNFWLSSVGVDIKLVGIFAMVSVPYAINFIWAPLLDRLRIPILSRLLGQRLSWIVVLQVALAASIYLLGLQNPENDLLRVAIYASLVSFLSSTQDIAIGALRSEVIEPSKQGQVAGTYTLGYRLGMLLASSGAIFCSNYFSWQDIYKIFALITLSFPIILIASLARLKIQKNLDNHIVKGSFIKNAMGSLGSPYYIATIMVFLVLYRLPDNFIYVMINPFLLQTGFDAIEIATVGKFLGALAAIIGGLIASFMMRKTSTINAMLYFGIVHAVAHSMFIIQNAVGYNLPLLFVVMGFESITGGMAMAAYIGFITSLCGGRYRATQYAVLSSMMGFSRSILPGISGFIVSEYGWQFFFLFTSVATIPSIVMLWYIGTRITAKP